MTDIVERLRESCSSARDYTETTYNKLLLREAADAIERLREHISHLEAHRDSLMAIIARQALEIELNNCIPEFSDVIGLPHH